MNKNPFENRYPEDVVGQGRIVPDEIPDDVAPLSGTTYIVENAVTYRNRRIESGKSMFVSLVTGENYVGLVERYDNNHVTVGLSNPIAEVLIESCREV